MVVGSGAEPQPKSDLMHFSLKISQLMPTILIIFLRINWRNFVQFFTQLGVLWVVSKRDNDACRFGRVRKHYYSGGHWGEKRRKWEACIQSNLVNYFWFGGHVAPVPLPLWIRRCSWWFWVFDSTHGSLSTAASDCQRHEYFVEPRLPLLFTGRKLRSLGIGIEAPALDQSPPNFSCR